MKDLVMTKLLDLVLPLVVGLIVPFALDLLKKASAWLDAAPATVKQVMAFVIAGLCTSLAQLLGIAVPTDLAAWDGPFVQTVLAGLLGITLKQQKQVKRLKTLTVPPLAVPHVPPTPDNPFHIPAPGDAPVNDQ